MTKYFLLVIAAFGIALALAPYIRRKFARVFNWLGRVRLWMRRLLQRKAVAIGRGFINIARNMGIDGQPSKDTLGSLTAIRNAQNVAYYENQLEAKLEDRDVKNIAITGPYGSGKTSLILTFFQRHPQYRPLYVSLAAFKDERTAKKKKKAVAAAEEEEDTAIIPSEDITPEQQKVLDDRIEYSILQQLFYHVKGKDVPFSRLKRIRTVTQWSIFRLAVGLITYVLCLIYTYKQEWLPGSDLWMPWFKRQDPWIQYLPIIGVVIGSMALVYVLFKFQKNASLIKLNLDKAQLEISPDKGASVLNQHMDEIVYYFAATKHDLLVIEDLDRFKNPEIFVKLREINSLINNSLQVNRKVTFIYALRDDVFINEDRTKFFDFILPVLPITNASNSAPYLIGQFEDLQLERPISNSFLNDLSLYITDRRLITQIVNEFRTYRQQLDNPQLNNDMLLGMIVYKNLHPTDFSDLQFNQGMVYDFLKKRPDMALEMVKEREVECALLEQKLQEVQAAHLKSVRELKLVYLAVLYKRILEEKGYDFTGRVQIRSNYYDIEEIANGDADLWVKLRSENPLHVGTRYSSDSMTFRFGEVEQEVDNTHTFEQRVAELQALWNYKIDTLKKDIGLARTLIANVKGYSIKELLMRKPLSKHETPIKKHEALTYLINNGYITEEYPYYISNFNEGLLSNEDFQFIMSVKDRSGLSWQHVLNNTVEVVNRLHESDCEDPAVFNFSLLGYLLDNEEEHAGKLWPIIRQLAGMKKANWDFIEGFRQHSPDHLGPLVRALIHITPQFWDAILHETPFEDEIVNQYLDAIILNGSEEDVIALDNNKFFSKSIEKSTHILGNTNKELFMKLSPLLSRLSIKFMIPPVYREKHDNSKLIRYVFEHNHFDFNTKMIDFLLLQLGITKDLEKFNAGQLTNILKTDIPHFHAYIRENFQAYIAKVFMLLPKHQDESQEVWMEILNSDALDNEVINALIRSLRFNVEDLSLVPVHQYDQLLAYSHVRADWDNMYQYVIGKKAEGILPPLINYVNHAWVYKELENDKLNQVEDDPTAGAFRNLLIDLLQHKSVSNAAKLALINAADTRLFIASFEHIDREVVMQMVHLNLIALDKAVLIALKERHFGAFEFLIAKQWSEVSPLLIDLALDVNDYTALLNDHHLIEDRQLTIYDSMDPDIFKKMILSGHLVPRPIFDRPQFGMTDEELEAMAGKIRYPEMIVGLIESNTNTITEKTAIKLLRPLGGGFEKIAKRIGKEVPNVDLIPLLLKALQKANILVQRFEVKNKIIEIDYIEVDPN